MSQTATIYRSKDGAIDYAPGGAVNGGDVIVIGGRVRIAKHDINTTGTTAAANTTGALSTEGIFDGPKDASTFSDGDPVYWNSTGNPTTGTAGSGCFTSTSAGNVFAGYAVQAQVTGDATVRFLLTSKQPLPRANVSAITATGSTQADAAALNEGFNAVSGGDGTKGVLLPVGVPGMKVVVKNLAGAAALKVWPATGAAINAVAANGSYSMAAVTSAEFYATSATQWYTVPLVAS